MEVYFDNAASTRALESVAIKMSDMMLNNYGNPAAMNIMGIKSENEIIKARKIISGIINSKSDEVYFTSGGTESNNWAIYGTMKGYNRSGKHIITTVIEHHAVSVPYKNLESEGCEVTYLAVDSKGYINIDELKNSIRNDTVLVSIIFVNNEIGTVQDLETIGKIIKEKNSNTLFHVDAVQAFGKYKINVQKSKIDLLTVSGHKIHGPKGVGILYMKDGLKVKPYIYGGGQQRGQRGGTENTPGAACIALAAEECYRHIEENNSHVKAVKSALMNGILNCIENVSVNGDNIDKSSPYVLSINFEGVKSEVLLHALEDKGIYVAAGSACNSKKKANSEVLEAIKCKSLGGAIRFSFSRFSTIEEAEYCVNTLIEIVPFLRKYNK